MTDVRCLQVDHINGGGNIERVSLKTTALHPNYFKKKILSGSKEYQILCANCNWIKRYEQDETSNKPKLIDMVLKSKKARKEPRWSRR